MWKHLRQKWFLVNIIFCYLSWDKIPRDVFVVLRIVVGRENKGEPLEQLLLYRGEWLLVLKLHKLLAKDLLGEFGLCSSNVLVSSGLMLIEDFLSQIGEMNVNHTKK